MLNTINSIKMINFIKIGKNLEIKKMIKRLINNKFKINSKIQNYKISKI